MKTYVRINWLVTIIGIILIFNYYPKMPDKIGFTFCFLVCQHFLINFLGLLLIDEDSLKDYWSIIIKDIRTIYRETINIIKFYLNF
jgi:hypothetical protein